MAISAAGQAERQFLAVCRLCCERGKNRQRDQFHRPHKHGAVCACTLALDSGQIRHCRFELDLHTDIGQCPKNVLGDK